MDRAIRRMWMAAGCVFILLMGTLSYIQFFDTESLKDNPWNSRSLYDNYGANRGSIVVDGTEIASSVKSDDEYNYQRVYSEPEKYAALTGYFSSVYGSTGVESAMDKELSGTSDSQFYDRVAQLFSGSSARGASVELTVDSKLQELANNLLQGRKGSIVAINPKTGEILAMASSPSYDPNTLASHDVSTVVSNYEELNSNPNNPLYNRAIAGNTYSPGSTFKIIDAVAALESGKYDANSTIDNPAQLPLPGTNVSLPNYAGGQCGGRTKATIEWAMAQSCNTPFAQIAMDLGEDRISRTAENFGYGQDLKIPLAVAKSSFPKGMSQSQLAQASVGQYDVRTTPLQVAMTSAAIANGGVQMKPNMIRSVKTSNLSVLYEFSPEKLRTSTSTKVADQVKQWMVNSVDNGIARNAGVPGYKVAGKTGTAETTGGLNNSWFTGFAPADDPQIAIAVVYEDMDATTGSQLSTNAGKQLFEAVLNK